MKLRQNCFHFILHPSAFILQKTAGRALPSARPASVGTSDGVSAELRTAPPPSDNDYLHNEKTRDAANNTGDARRARAPAVSLPTRACVDSHIDRRAREADACPSSRCAD